MKSIRTEWQVRCAFNSFCKQVLKHEAVDAYNQRRKNTRHKNQPFLTLHHKKKISFLR
ncbi:hypothetical protein [Metalysinibacillus jejuensis]|uniref:hypothetical protein n=1 Tax=Metalysinibacillus jejuensis TaxID=914327 RepID=UPI0019140FDF|nr:hypothetical protein [Metalysinibacillus jejuensis]